METQTNTHTDTPLDPATSAPPKTTPTPELSNNTQTLQHNPNLSVLNFQTGVILSSPIIVIFACLWLSRGMNATDPLPIKYSLVHDGCFPVSKDDLERGVAYDKFNLAHLRSSMLHHMNAKGYRGICAMNLGIPLCYMLVNTGQDHDFNGVLDMYNVNITGKSQSTVSSLEGSPMCIAGAVYVTRYSSIYTEFMNAEGEVMEYVYMKGNLSTAVQHLYALEHGIRPCDIHSGKASTLKAMASV